MVAEENIKNKGRDNPVDAEGDGVPFDARWQEMMEWRDLTVLKTNVVSKGGQEIDPVKADADTLSIETLRKSTLHEINKNRPETGKLVLNDKLNIAAQEHADDMNKNDLFSHKGSDGKTPGDRVRATKYEKHFLHECIHNGPRTIETAIADFMASDAHAGDIQDEYNQEVGIGYMNGYWTLVFGGNPPRMSTNEG